MEEQKLENAQKIKDKEIRNLDGNQGIAVYS